MGELDNELYEQIKRHCRRGDELAEEQQFEAALTAYSAAWELLPEPRTTWSAATWILAAIGDALFLAGDFEAGRDHLSMAMDCPDAIGNPFLHLRLGQCQVGAGQEDQGAQPD